MEGIELLQLSCSSHRPLRSLRTYHPSVRLGGEVLPLTVDFRSRHHATGRLPPNRRLSDNTGPMTDAEALAARAVDRALRPWIAGAKWTSNAEGGGSVSFPGGIDVRVSVQEYDPFPEDGRRHADPVALAVNAAFAACVRALQGTGLAYDLSGAGCVRVAMRRDGSYVLDPDPAELDEECVFDLLYAGTRRGRRGGLALMAEGGARERRGGGGDERAPVTEDAVEGALLLARLSANPIADEIAGMVRQAEMERTQVGDGSLHVDDGEVLAGLMGIDLPEGEVEDDPPHGAADFGEADAASLRERAVTLIWDRLGRAALALFGGVGGDGRAGEGCPEWDGKDPAAAEIHSGEPLLPKAARGRRERVVRAEIERILPELLESEAAGSPPAAVVAAHESILSDRECVRSLTTYVHETIMKRAMDECAARDLRSDGRAGRGVVRPVGCTVPALGDAVHGSAGGSFQVFFFLASQRTISYFLPSPSFRRPTPRIFSTN